MKEEFDYSPIAKEIGWNFDKVKYEKVSLSGFNYYITVLKEINEKTKMLDIGCGCGEKSIKYFSLAKEVVMLDNEKEMIKKAKENVKTYYGDTKKFTFLLGDKNEKLNYPDEYFDLIVSRHCGANMDEVFRLLKPKGVFISEDYDEDDCLSLKEHFGYGQGYENYKNNIREKRVVLDKCIDLNFSKCELFNFEETEFYKTENDLKYLLYHTPILNCFEKKDEAKLSTFIKENVEDKGIKLTRKLYAIRLEK